MKTKIYSFKQLTNLLALILALQFLVVLTLEQSVSAGILFNNKNQVIRTSRPTFRQQNYNVRKSTAVMNATSTRLVGRDYGGVSSQMKLIKARYKYDVKLAKWEEKRQQQIAKQLQKKRLNDQKEAQRKAREAERIRKKKERDAAKIKAANDSNQQMASASQSSSRGAFGIFNSQGKKKGFWSSIMQALFGKKGEGQ